jgi:dihydrofolate reductase
MRRLNVSTLVTLDGVIQDPGGFQELEEGGWGNRYFDEEAQRYALEHLRESDAFLCGRVTYEVFKEFWPQVKEGEYAETLNQMPKFVASRTLEGAPRMERDPASGGRRRCGWRAQAPGGS